MTCRHEKIISSVLLHKRAIKWLAAYAWPSGRQEEGGRRATQPGSNSASALVQWAKLREECMKFARWWEACCALMEQRKLQWSGNQLVLSSQVSTSLPAPVMYCSVLARS